MINPVTSSATPATSDSKPASGSDTIETPFGEVMANQISTPNLAALFGQAASPTPHETTPHDTTPSQSGGSNAAAGSTTNAAPSAGDPSGAPTLETEFGSQTFMNDPTGAGLVDYTYNFNPIYFATQQTAEKVAGMLGGTVVESSAMVDPHSAFHQNQLNEMVQMADGRQINAGLVANFYSHGYSQSYIDSLINAEKDGTAI